MCFNMDPHFSTEDPKSGPVDCIQLITLYSVCKGEHWYPGSDSNRHCSASKAVASYQLRYQGIYTFMNYDYFERKMGSHAQRTSRTKGKDFIPTYTYNPNRVEIEEKQQDPDKTFVPTVWPQFYEVFGASSRNRT